MMYRSLAIFTALLLPPVASAHASDAQKQSPEADHRAATALAHGGLPAAAGTVRLTVDTSQPQWRISRYLTGMHFVYGFERDSLYQDERIADWMRRAKVGMIRWPGGTAVQTYHWDRLSGISFKADTWDPDDKTPPASPADYMDLDEYIAFCRRIGAEPLVGVNLGSGRRFNRLEDSLDEARRLIHYCREKNYRVRHWYIGNECFKGWTAAKYAEYIDLYAEVLKSVDPNIVIIGDWKFGKRFDEAVLIAKTSRHLDVMEIHEKWGNEWGMNEDGGSPTLENWQRESGIYSGRLDDYTRRFLAEMKAAGRNVRLAFNEWGADMAGPVTPFHVALVKADYLITLFSHPVYSACDWNLNMGSSNARILVTSKGGHELTGFNPAAHVFELCAPALEKLSVALTSSDRFVYGFATQDSGREVTQVFLLNKHSTAKNVELVMNARKPGALRCEVVSFVEPGVVRTIVHPLLLPNVTPAFRLAPLSFTRITTTHMERE